MSVVLVPLQMVVVPLMLGDGNALTVTTLLVDAEQLLEFVTVTVYVDGVVGLTVRWVFVLLSSHLYVSPPLAVSVVLVPLQMVVVPLMLGDGNALTVTTLLVDAEQLLEFVTVTV